MQVESMERAEAMCRTRWQFVKAKRWGRLRIGLFYWVWSAVLLVAGGPAEDWKILSIDPSMADWQGQVGQWECRDGILRSLPGADGVLFTKESYDHFEVELDFRLPPGGNNGLAIRYPGTGRASVDAMCEIQILDDDAPQYASLDPRQYHGAIYGMVAPKRGYLHPAGQWNHQRVTVVGSWIQVELNGTVIAEGDLSQITEFKDGTQHPGKDRRDGFLGFCGHQDPVEFRQVRVRRLTPFRLGAFSVDVTIPLGHRCMGLLPQKSASIADPLLLHGLVLLGPDKPWVLMAIDWCEVRNESYRLWQERIAEAVGTVPEQVWLNSLHQHDAPVIDHGAQRLLDQVGLPGELFDPVFHEEVLGRAVGAAKLAMESAVPCTDIGMGQAQVEKVASNRRHVASDGTVDFSRGSSSGREPRFRDAEEGLIDPWLRTLSFWNGSKCLAQWHVYATHPMSYYGRGEVTSDFVGLARERLRREDPSIHQMYGSGCSGDVTAGKFNSGTPEDRIALTDRMYRAMVASAESTRTAKLESIRGIWEPLEIRWNPKPSLARDTLTASLRDSSLPTEKRIYAAMSLASLDRLEKQPQTTLPCLDLGAAQLFFLPGEAFVGYQLNVQQRLAKESELHATQRWPLVLGYADCWTGYVPTREAVEDRFDDSWYWVDPQSWEAMERGIDSVVRQMAR
ncbi:MAG: DUF1080 domain-containing protein [Pirellulaceae bacterium]